MKISIFYIVFVKLCFSSALKEDRIILGRPAAYGEFPYQVGLSLKKNGTTWCGGSLLNHHWILTAAHCTYRATEVKAFLGTILRARANYTYVITAKNMFTHTGFKPKTLQNDIALIKLPKRIRYTKEISPIKLARDNRRNYVNRIATASGWGRTGENFSQTLNYAALPVISIATCKRHYGPKINKIHICVSTVDGSSTCHGDSGGPLTIKLANNDRVQIALTSFVSPRGCESGEPAIFTRTSFYIGWIKRFTTDF